MKNSVLSLSFFLLSGLFTPSFAATHSDCLKHQCLAVIDAGSTGSRLHLYTYDIDKTKSPINIKETWVKKIKPGFAMLEPSQAVIDNYLNNLFADTPSANLSIYFYATGGMRLLPQPKQKILYGLLQNWFVHHPQWHLKASKTVTGSEEGLFGWLAVNYQLGAFNSDEQKPVGVMDMGGASVQITFPIENTDGIKESDLKKLKLYGREIKLFTHSFLGLGQTETSHQFFESSDCFASNYELPTGLPAMGQAQSCKEEVSTLINNVHHVSTVVQPIMQANSIDKWFVLGGLVYLVQSKPFQFDNYKFSTQALLEQADLQVCHQQWTSLSAQYPGNDYLYVYCLFPSYYYALIVDGYGIQPQQEINYLPSTQSGDWTLGVVLNQHVG